ncbi:alpha/beta hydrolase [Effusibacillus lacus]|uniref:Enterochelin esterase n=1 Tax=Effusibacillus lacus TaxID=1348429 RepID=A0A292YPZ1_9BACL|nr:alpha/beta hydrolase-fold protein [Effusibacillus lacus]TCS76514.1 enterochelin esterase-like enzyme [Effusibacillus lacus]GAX90464.1 enterochelin esterase [Effusibacillus lacus]
MSDIYKRKVIGETIDSKHTGRAMDVRIFLPPGFSELTAYPILYTQDGQDFFMYGRIATIAQQLILEEGLEPFVIVGVDVNRKERTSEYSSTGSRNHAYRQFFLDELLPFIENRYRVPGTGYQRVLAGDSLGGTVSFDIALDQPDLFQGILSLSGAFLPPLQERIRETDPFPPFDLYLLVGEQETAVETHFGDLDFVGMNRTTRDILTGKKARLTYVEKPGIHTWGFWQKELPDALRHFFKSNIWFS